MRLFTGIAIPEDVLKKFTILIERLRTTAHINWSPPYNLHLTTKFIGEWPQERLPELVNALQPLRKRSPIEIGINGLGWLPNPHSPRILFAAIRSGPDLAQLAADTEEALAPLGIAREKREFSPHLTLARIKDPAVPLAPLRTAIAQLKSVEFGKFAAHTFKLYLSKPGPAGSIYTQLAEFRFEQ